MVIIGARIVKARTHFSANHNNRKANKDGSRFIVDRRGEPLVVIMRIKDFIDTIAPEPEVLTLIGEASKRNEDAA